MQHFDASVFIYNPNEDNPNGEVHGTSLNHGSLVVQLWSAHSDDFYLPLFEITVRYLSNSDSFSLTVVSPIRYPDESDWEQYLDTIYITPKNPFTRPLFDVLMQDECYDLSDTRLAMTFQALGSSLYQIHSEIMHRSMNNA